MYKDFRDILKLLAKVLILILPLFFIVYFAAMKFFEANQESAITIACAVSVVGLLGAFLNGRL
ncbi:hypothetical protein [Cysteiniphilum sp. 19S12-1]|uniref:hypothetical protein n=1 Tax=Cysteiniphilum sp. 19S12-1 TaxID=3453130 RepID=UPI003F84BA1B